MAILVRFLCVLCVCIAFVAAQQTLTNCANPKHLAVTIDDGGCNWVSHDGMLDALKERGIKASFQVVGQNIKSAETLVKRYFNEGHYVCNHMWTHTNPSGMSAASIKSEVKQTWDELRRVANSINKPMPKFHFMRPPNGGSPGGGWGDSLSSNKVDRVLMWSIDTQDYNQCTTDQVIQKIKSAGTGKGQVLLLHGQYPADNTKENFLKVLDTVKSQGYEFVTPDVCAGLANETTFENTEPATNACATNFGGCDQTNGDCKLTDGKATCSCKAGFIMGANNNCAQPNACATNFGGCDQTNGECKLTNNAAVCSCKSGYTMGADKKCTLNPPANACATSFGGCDRTNGNCQLTAAGAAQCSCKQGFTMGDDNKCTAEPKPGDNETEPECNPACRNGGKCEVTGNRARCACPPAFSGNYCQSAVNLCKTDNGGCDEQQTCKMVDGEAQCSGGDGGDGGDGANAGACSATVRCRNGGTCSKGVCACARGFSGALCQSTVEEEENENPEEEGSKATSGSKGLDSTSILLIVLLVVLVVVLGVVAFCLMRRSGQARMDAMMKHGGDTNTTPYPPAPMAAPGQPYYPPQPPAPQGPYPPQ